MPNNSIKAIAFYLPQFHPIPENDEWWGRGFTEWRNVTKAKSLFPGHYQPHLPADLGFYDLRLPEVREAQAKLASQYGIHGFCYYHYWFNGRRILERPFNEVLESGKPDLPFCLCWANENWTRRWDGENEHVLLKQNYGTEDDVKHIQSLIPAFRDPRYIRVDGRPLYLVYRAELLPNPKMTTDTWRKEAANAGLGDLYLVRVESYESARANRSPQELGFDAEVEFAPFSWPIGNVKHRGAFSRFLAAIGLLPKVYVENKVIDYEAMMRGMLRRQVPTWKRFHCVTPSWDNSARKRRDASIFPGSTPEKYENWIRQVIAKTLKKHDGDERLVFINAWNEWAEGNHLEPDLRWGHAYLEATKRALQTAEINPATTDQNVASTDSVALGKARSIYWKTSSAIKRQFELLQQIKRPK